LLEAFFADIPCASLHFATADAAVAQFSRRDGSGFVSTRIRLVESRAATVTGGVSSLVAFAFSVFGVLVVALQNCGSIPNRDQPRRLAQQEAGESFTPFTSSTMRTLLNFARRTIADESSSTFTPLRFNCGESLRVQVK